MNYQTEEVLPMLDGANRKNNSNQNKQSFGLAAVMILCLAVTSFMAGHASSSAATASVLQSQQASGSTYNPACGYFTTKVTENCGAEAGACVTDVMYGSGGDYASCKPDDASAMCSRYIDYPPSMC